MSIMSTEQSTTPRASLSIGDGIAMMVGLIIGVGIFKLPFLVALNVDSSAMFIGLWVVGGVITLIGALVYAELAAAYPSTGGEYHFLTRAYGNDVGLLFAWARTTVIQTGAIAGLRAPHLSVSPEIVIPSAGASAPLSRCRRCPGPSA